MTIEEKQQEIIEDFSFYDDWMDKYGYLIELGNELQPIDAQKKNEKNIIKGCQSRVWLHAELKDDGKVYFEGDSDAVIVKGLVALLLKVVSERTPQELLENELHFINDIGLSQHLSPTRSNGLLSMIKQIKLYAVAFDQLQHLINCNKKIMDKRIDQIIENLKEVYDPEIPVNVYDLGLIYNVDIDENSKVTVIMTLTAPGCPVVDLLIEDIREAVLKTEGVEDADIELTFEPPWDKSMMSEEARLELGFF